MMKKIIKLVVITLMVSLIIPLITVNISNAGLVDPLERPDAYHPGINIETSNDRLIEKANVIINIMQIVGIIIAVITLMVIGLRYMFGSVAERATYKETLVPYLVGAILLFSVVNIVKIIYEIIKSSIYI